MRDSARFHFGFTVPYVAHFSAQAAVEAVGEIEGRSGAGLGDFEPHAMVAASWKPMARRRSSRGCRSSSAPTIRPRCRCSWSRASPTAPMVTEVETWSVRVSGWNAEIARALSPLAEIVAVPDTAFDGAALLVSVAGANRLEKIKLALIQAGASVRSTALVGSHATRYTVPANGSAKP